MFRDMRGTSSNKYSPQLYIYKVYWKKNHYDMEIIIKNIDCMKKLIAIAFALVPCLCMAQGDWEKPVKQNQEAKKALFSKNPANEDPKYLEGAVPTVDGKVVFTLDKDVPGKDAQQIYDIVYNVLEKMTTAENQFKESQVSLVNKKEHVIAARYREWLVFKNTFLALDRTVFNYTIIANCSDGHLNMMLSRIFYSYETERDDTNGMETSADEWITDKYALNKSKTKLSKYSGKFRRKTIDRKDEIFKIVSDALEQ